MEEAMSANPLMDRLKANEPSYVFSVRMARTINIVAMAESPAQLHIDRRLRPDLLGGA
jgi:hypothetical protein